MIICKCDLCGKNITRKESSEMTFASPNDFVDGYAFPLSSKIRGVRLAVHANIVLAPGAKRRCVKRYRRRTMSPRQPDVCRACVEKAIREYGR